MSSPPLGYYAPPATDSARPIVVTLFRIYAGVIAVASGAASFLMLTVSAHDADDVGRDVVYFFLLVSACLAVLHAVAACVPRTPWGWTLALVVLALGLPSCALGFALPLLVLWLRPECKAAFMRL